MTGNNAERARWFDAVLIVLVAPVVVAGCFSAPFLGFDDQGHVGHASIALDAPWYKAFRPVPGAGDYFPVTLLSYRFDRWFYGSWLYLLFPESGNAPGYRLTSLLIHLTSALVLWRIFLRLKAGRWCSLFAAAAWVAHPAACESVAWISERKNVLAAFLGFMALWIWVREWEAKRRWVRGPVAFLFYLLALLSKPVAAGFLAVFVAYEALYSVQWRWLESPTFLFQRRENLLRKRARRDEGCPWLVWGALLVMFLITVVLAWVNIKGEAQEFTQRLGGSIFNTLLTDIEILRLYICNMLLPLWLSFFYHVDALTSFSDSRLWISAGFLTACLLVSLWFVVERRTVLFLWSWFLGALLPTLNVIPKFNQMQDRYAYFSLPALLLLLALSVAGGWRRLCISPGLRRACLALLGGMACLCLAVLAVLRSELFDYDIKLYSDALEKQPQALYVHANLGFALFRDAECLAWKSTVGQQAQLRAMREEALEHLKLALSNSACRSHYPLGNIQLDVGILNMRLEKTELARKQIEIALKTIESHIIKLRRLDIGDAQLRQSRSDALLALAELAVKEGQAEAAMDYTAQAGSEGGLANPLVLYWRGRALEELGDIKKALVAYRMIPPGDMVFKEAATRIKRLENNP